MWFFLKVDGSSDPHDCQCIITVWREMRAGLGGIWVWHAGEMLVKLWSKWGGLGHSLPRSVSQDQERASCFPPCHLKQDFRTYSHEASITSVSVPCVLLGSGTVFLWMQNEASHYATVALLAFSLNTVCSHCLHLSSAMELDSKESMSTSKMRWTLCALGLSMTS